MYVLASIEWSNNDPLDYEVKVEANQTACSYLKQFDLQDFFTEYINFILKVSFNQIHVVNYVSFLVIQIWVLI